MSKCLTFVNLYFVNIINIIIIKLDCCIKVVLLSIIYESLHIIDTKCKPLKQQTYLLIIMINKLRRG